MSTITFNQAINTVGQLPVDQQEMLIDIFRKRLIEAERQKIARDARESLSAFRQGQFTAQSANQVIQELHKGNI